MNKLPSVAFDTRIQPRQKPRLRYNWESGLWAAPDALYGTRRYASAQADALSRTLYRFGDTTVEYLD